MVDVADAPHMSTGISSVPETHLIRGNTIDSQSLMTRINQKGKLFVSVFDDSPKLEWKISCCHSNTSAFVDILNAETTNRSTDSTLLILQPEGVPVHGKAVTNIIDGFLSKDPCCNRQIIVSSFHISLSESTYFDIVRHANLDTSSHPSRV